MSLGAIGWLQSNLGLDMTGEWNQIVHLRIGGHSYTCMKKLFRGHESSVTFSAILEGTLRTAEDGSMIIDRDGTNFRHVLTFLRTRMLLLPDGFDEWDLLLDDAQFYQLPSLLEAVRAHDGFQRRELRRAAPPAVYLTWHEKTGAVQLVPGNLPHMTVAAAATDAAPSSDGAAAAPVPRLHYMGRPLGSVEEAVFVFMSAYRMHIEQWQRPTPGNSLHHILLAHRQ